MLYAAIIWLFPPDSTVLPLFLVFFFSPGLSLLLLGCALIFLSGIMVAVSAILYIKAKKLRKGQKLQSSGNTMSQISKNCKIELKYKKKKFDLKKK